jgi:hypothetical protein
LGRLPAATTIASAPFFGFDAVSALAGFASLALSIYISVTVIIPLQIQPPVLGWILAYEWISFLTLTVFGSYLGLCYTLGTLVSPSLASPRAHISVYSSKKEDGEAGSEACGAVSTAIWCQLAIHSSRLWYSSGCIERKTAPQSSLLGLSPNLLPILIYGKE